MAYYLSEQEAFEAYADDAKEAFKLFESYDEIERLANARPKDKLPEGFTGVTDADLASSLRKIPKEYMAQLFTGKVKAIDAEDAWVAELAQLRWDKKITRHANYEDLFFNKIIDWGYRANKYGSQPMLAFHSVSEAYAGANCALPYIRNVILEKGAVSDLGSNRIYLVQYYDKYRLKGIIAAAEAEEKKAKKEKRDSYNTWVIANLKKLLDNGSEDKKDSRQQNYTERQNNITSGGYKIIHCFQRGSEAPYYSFAPSLDEKDNVVKRDKCTNPTGDMPVIFLYTDIERENPYGLGVAALAAPNQNVQDAMTQLSVLNGFMLGRPSFAVKGNRNNVDLNSIKNIPDKLQFHGDADIQPIKTNASSFFSQFPNTMGFYKTQQQKILGSRDGSVSAQSGDPNFSKTSAGVKENVRSNNIDGNFLTNRHEQAYARLATTMLNIDFANMEGTDLIEILEDEASILDKAGMEMDRDGDGRITSREALIEFDRMRYKYEFEVDANSSKEQNDAQDAEELSGNVQVISRLAQLVTTYGPEILLGDYKFKTGEFANTLLRKQGLPDIDKFLVKVDPQEMNATQPAETDAAGATNMPTTPAQKSTGLDGNFVKERADYFAQKYQVPIKIALQIVQKELSGEEPDEIMEFVTQQGALDG